MSHPKIEKTTYGPTTLFGKRYTLSMEEFQSGSFFDRAFTELMGHVSSLEIEMNGPGTVIYYEWNFETKMTTCFPCAPIREAVSDLPEGYEIIDIPRTEAYLGVHTGDYSTLGEMHSAVMSRAEEDKAIMDVDIEEYIVDPSKNPDPASWITNVYVLVK